MLRKWMILAATMLSVSVLAAGISLADDEESPLHKLMEKVNAKSNAIKKAYRTPVAFKKAQAAKEITTNAEELLKLAKESKELAKDGAKKAKGVKDPEKKWVELSDVFISKAEKFVEEAGKATTKDQLKAAYNGVNQSCTECHTVFRTDEESF